MKKDDFEFLLDKINLVNNKDDIQFIINKFYKKVWEWLEWKINIWSFLEALMFYSYYVFSYWGNKEDINWVYEKNFIYYDDNIYVYENWEWLEQEWDTLFATSRDTWYHPFFLHIEELSKKKTDIYILKPNLYINNWMYNDKWYFLSKFVWKETNYQWNVVFPFIMDISKNSIFQLLDFVKNNIWNKVVIKSVMWEMWYNVKALNLQSYDEVIVKKIIEKFFISDCYWFNVPYFVEYWDIKNEFRLYYNRDVLTNKLKVYSVKKKNNYIKGDWNIFSKDSFAMYKDIDVVRSFRKIEDFYKDFSYVIDALDDISKYLWLETWVIELAELNDKSIKFIEVNPLGWTLLFPGDDEKRIEEFYSELWWNIFKRKKLYTN